MGIRIGLINKLIYEIMIWLGICISLKHIVEEWHIKCSLGHSLIKLWKICV